MNKVQQPVILWKLNKNPGDMHIFGIIYKVPVKWKASSKIWKEAWKLYKELSRSTFLLLIPVAL